MSEQLFLEAFNSEPYFFEKEEKYGAMDIIYTFEDESGHGFKFHFEKKVALGKHAYVCVLSQKTPGLKTYKRVIGKFSNPMRTVATLLAVVRDIHATRKDVHGIVMSIPEQAFGSYSRLVKKIMTRELRTVLNVEDGEYTPEDFEKMGLVGIVTTVKPRNMNTVYTGPALKEYQERQAAKDGAGISTPAAVVPEDKKIVEIEMSGPIPSLSFSHNKETPFVRRIVEDLFSKYNMTQRDLIRSNGKEIIVPFRYEVDLEVVKGILIDVIAALKSKGAVPILKGPTIKKLLDSPAPNVKTPPAAAVPDVKVSNVILSAKASINKTGTKIVFEAGSLVQGFDNSDLKAAAQNIASRYQSVTPFVETSGVGFTSKNVLDALKAANELSLVAKGNGYQIKVTAESALSTIGFKLSELNVKFSLTGLDASNAKLTYTENGESVKLLALSLGWSAIGGNGSYSLMSYNGDVEQLRSSLKEYGTELNKPDGPVDLPKQTSVAQTMPTQVNADGVTTIKFEVTKFDKDADTAFNANIFGRDSIEGGIALRLMRDKIKKIASKTGQLPAMLARSIFMEGETLKARFDSNLLAEVVAMIRSLEGATLQFKGLERLEDLIPKQPVVDPVAVKDPYYFDYDHRQITLTFKDEETASRIKEQLLELGAATFNDSEFSTDKEKLILVDDKSLDVKKVQETLFPILGNPLMINDVFADPNIRSSVRSPDGVIYRIKGNTIQVEDAPKDSAMTIVRTLIPMADRIFDDKGSNTLELNEQGIADGFTMHNIAPVFKKSNISKRLSARLFRSWESAVTEASNKYDLSTGDLGSSFTNNSSYLIDAATSGVVGEYLRTDGNVISGIVLNTYYMIREAVAKPLVALGFTVEYDVQGWRTQVKLPVNSDYTIPGTSELAVFIKEVDNLANIARRRRIVEYVGGNKNFEARWNPDDSRAFLILPTAESSGLGWRDYTAYATAPEYVRVDNIETYEEFLKLTEFVKNFDFGANLLRNIGVSKYLSDVRSGGATASKSYKLKDGGEVEISFKFGDKVMFAFNQASKGFDRDLSEWVDEKNEIFGRISAIALYKLGTADANKTLKNIDAWLDEHIVSKEDNASKGNGEASAVAAPSDKKVGSSSTSKFPYSIKIDGTMIVIHSSHKVVTQLEKKYQSLINQFGATKVVTTGVKNAHNRLLIAFDKNATPDAIQMAYEHIISELGAPRVVTGPVSELTDSYNKYEIDELFQSMLKKGKPFIFAKVAKTHASASASPNGVVLFDAEGNGRFFDIYGGFMTAKKSVDWSNKFVVDAKFKSVVSEFVSGNKDKLGMRADIFRLSFDTNSATVYNPGMSKKLDEGLKEDLTGKAPNRIKRELLEVTLQKLGLARESFTYGNATFKTVVTECAVEIIPTSGNIRNFAKMLGARLGQELRIDDEGFLSFDLDNI